MLFSSECLRGIEGLSGALGRSAGEAISAEARLLRAPWNKQKQSLGREGGREGGEGEGREGGEGRGGEGGREGGEGGRGGEGRGGEGTFCGHP